MGCFVAEAQKRCSSREFAEWLVMREIQPWGERQADVRAGWIAATISNTQLSRAADARTPATFFPHLDADKPEQTPEEQMALLEGWLGGA